MWTLEDLSEIANEEGQPVLVLRLCGFSRPFLFYSYPTRMKLASLLCVEAPPLQASYWKERPRLIEETGRFTSPWEELCVVALR